MEKIGLLAEIVKSMEYIANGRNGLATEGTAEEGRMSFTKGLLMAQAVFEDVYANVGNDLKAAILAEQVYLIEERDYCSDAEQGVFASMTAGIDAFDDALRALSIVQDTANYKIAEKTWPHLPQYRYHDMPKDAFHIACIADSVRINNTLRTPGITDIERQVYDRRLKNITAMQAAYLIMQQVALKLEKK